MLKIMDGRIEIQNSKFKTQGKSKAEISKRIRPVGPCPSNCLVVFARHVASGFEVWFFEVPLSFELELWICTERVLLISCIKISEIVFLTQISACAIK